MFSNSCCHGMKAIQYLFSVIFAFYDIVRITVLENSNGQKTVC